MRSEPLRGQSGAVGKILVVWLLIVAVFGVAAVDSASILFAKYHVTDVAGTAASTAAENYQSTHDQSIKANAAAHLRALQVDEDVSILEALVARYRDRTGRLPGSFSDLEAAGSLRGTPVDPLGHPYRLMQNGHVVVRVPDDLPFLKKGTPPGYVPPQTPKLLPTD